MIGLLFAFGALLGWGIGDFWIQKTTRIVGVIRTLFYIGVFGSVFFFPFAAREAFRIFSDPLQWPLIVLLSLIISGAAVANFNGLKQGKLAVVLPVTGLELAVSVITAFFIFSERYPLAVYACIFATLIGILLMTIEGRHKQAQGFRWEKGVIFALLGALGLGLSNVLVGHAARQWSPLFVNWLMSVVVMLLSFIVMIRRGQLPRIKLDLIAHPLPIIIQSVLDNFAWICFAYAALFLPLGIATTISEGYLVLGSFLGIFLNHERFRRHQIAGIAIAIMGILTLSWLI